MRGNAVSSVSAVFEEVRDLVSDTLQLGDGASAWTRETPLLGEVPELDSYAALHVLTALSEHFGIEFADDEVTGETFATLGTLVDLVDAKLA